MRELARDMAHPEDLDASMLWVTPSSMASPHTSGAGTKQKIRWPRVQATASPVGLSR